MPFRSTSSVHRLGCTTVVVVCLGLCARLGGSVVTARFTRLIASTMIEHARALALPSVNLHACAGHVAYFVAPFLEVFGASLLSRPFPQI